ncbi:hypothetical protein ABIA33_002032 [Streptacidiphilus sp. MAP12-16]|uniref:DUF6777 domain-containing protein n=1 Tax=Streptacidiphilus sp. MAP12-16 TaxID=3156300 RepID=UPI0035194E90
MLATAVVAAAAVLAVVLTRPSTAQAVTLQPAGSTGPDPFTPSVAGKATASASAAPGSGASTTGNRSVHGSDVGLYGGTERLSSCDVAQLSAFLVANPDKGRAWAGVEGISQNSIAPYLRSLTAVVLRMDTRVTNHGFSNGAATEFQSVLQAGTAVLIDPRGLPRARCACGNPLLPPVGLDSSETFTGTAWPSFRPTDVVVVVPSVTQVTVIVLFDPSTGAWFSRPVGGAGETDHRVPPPSPTATESSSASSSASSSPSGSPSGSPSPSASSGSPTSPSSSPSPSPSPSASSSGPPSSSSAASSGTSSSAASSLTTSSSAAVSPLTGSQLAPPS